MARIDELERDDARFARDKDGNLRDNFHGNLPSHRPGPNGGQESFSSVQKQRDQYISRMQSDVDNWRKGGDEAAARRAEIQIAYQRSEWESTAASRIRERTTDPDLKDQAHERMLEADRDGELANKRLERLDADYETQSHFRRQEERVRLEAMRRREDVLLQQQQEAAKPMRERLTEAERLEYDRVHKGYGAEMERYLTPRERAEGKGWWDRGEAEQTKFDRMYEQHRAQRAVGGTKHVAQVSEEREPATAEALAGNASPRDALVKREEHVDTAQPQVGEGSGGASERLSGTAARDAAPAQHSVPASEAHAADGKQHSPVLRQHQGYRAEVHEDGKSIGYRRADDGDLGFTDYGQRVSLGSNKRQEDVQAALTHADSKFSKFNIRGSREQQEAIAREAARMDTGVADKIGNEDLRRVVDDERQKMAEEKAQKAIRDAREASQGVSTERGADERHGQAEAPSLNGSDAKHQDRAERIEDQKGRADERSDTQRAADANQPESSDSSAAKSGNKSRTLPTHTSRPQAAESDSASDIQQTRAAESRRGLPKPDFYDDVKSNQAASNKNGSGKSAGQKAADDSGDSSGFRHSAKR